MKVSFIYNDLEKEVQYLCFLAKSISKGFYQNGSFHVLPYLEKMNNKAVFFPDLNYSQNFWNKIIACPNKDLGKSYPKECVEEVLSKLPHSKTINASKIISEWQKKEKVFLNSLSKIFKSNDLNIDIDILITNYGTLGSFKVLKNKFLATHRVDNHPDDIGRKILYCLVRNHLKKTAEIGEPEWFKRRDIVEYLLNNTNLKKIIPNAKTAAPRKKEQELINDSDEYLDKLGFSPKNHVVKVSGWGKITIEGKEIEKMLTPKEFYVIKKLTSNKGRVVDFAEFDKIPSLYALSKTIENIRKKLRNLGINKEILFTKRGKGYFIN